MTRTKEIRKRRPGSNGHKKTGAASLLIDEAAGEKCVRCYQIRTDLGSVSGHEGICGRCADAADHFVAAAE